MSAELSIKHEKNDSAAGAAASRTRQDDGLEAPWHARLSGEGKAAAPRKKAVMNHRTPRGWLPLIAILALAAAVRCQHLGDLSFWFDESFCWKATTFPAAEIWDRVAQDNHPPLYFYLLFAWTRVFGESPVAMRSLSVLLGLMAVVGAYLLVRQVERGRAVSAANRPHPSPLPEGEGAGERAGLLAALLVALSPMQIDWSQLVRMYVLGAALTLVSSWLLALALAAPRPRWQDFAWYAISAAALLYTHYFGLFIVAAQGCCAIACALRRGALLGHMLSAFFAVELLWSPWLPVFLGHRERVVETFWSQKFVWNDVARACGQMFAPSWLGPPSSPAIGWSAAAGCLIVAAGVAALARGARLLGLGALATFGGAIAASIASRNIVVPRYFVFANALLLCCAAVAVMRLGWPAWRRGLPHAEREGYGAALRAALAAALVVGSGWLCLEHVAHREATAESPGMMAAMAWLAEERRPDELVIVADTMSQIVAASHADNPNAVRVFAKPTAFLYMHGTAVMRDAEYITREELAAAPGERLWIVCHYHNQKLDLPEPWVDVSEESFREWMTPGNPVVVRRCLRRGERRMQNANRKMQNAK